MVTLTIAGNRPARENVRHVPRLEIGPLLLAVLDRIDGWVERRGQRLTLAELTEAQLKDVGLSPADVAREAAKPFWQA